MIDDYRKAQEEAEEFARKHEFCFFIFRGCRYEWAGYKSEDREATGEECILWTALGGPHAYSAEMDK